MSTCEKNIGEVRVFASRSLLDTLGRVDQAIRGRVQQGGESCLKMGQAVKPLGFPTRDHGDEWFYYWLVGQGHPSENMSSSIGMIRNPIYGKIKLMATKPPTGIWVKVYIICLILTRKKFLGYPKLTQKKSGWSEILPSFGSKKYQWVHPVEKTLSTTHNPSFPQVLVDGCLKILKRVEICWNMLKSWVSTSKTISRFQVQLKKKKRERSWSGIENPTLQEFLWVCNWYRWPI